MGFDFDSNELWMPLFSQFDEPAYVRRGLSVEHAVRSLLDGLNGDREEVLYWAFFQPLPPITRQQLRSIFPLLQTIDS